MAATGRDTATARNNQGYAVQGQNVRKSLANYETTDGFRLTGLATMRVPTMILPPIAGGGGGWAFGSTTPRQAARLTLPSDAVMLVTNSRTSGRG
jgi:hypothetical protein